MKSHDCHVFMQTFIPIAYRGLLLKKICDALTKITFFQRYLFEQVVYPTYEVA